MKARKLLATILALAMTLSMLSVGAFAAETEDEKNGVMPISETEQTAPVSTLPADAAASWASGSIERWTNSGIVKGDGDGNFNPDAPLSRAELAQIFVNMFGLTVKADNVFGDLKGDEWYADAILKCVAAGIIKGDGVNANAEAKISRQETIVMFGRAVGVTPDENPDLSKFTDASSVADWAAGYMAPLTKMGILSGGGDGTINAGGQIDRASTMALMDKAVAEYVNAPGEYKVDDVNKFVVVNMSAKEGEIVISGATAGVTVSAGTAEGKIVAKDLKTDTIKVDGTAALNVEGKSSVGEVVANATGTVTVAKGVTVDTVTANAAGTITNNGTIKELTANAAVKVDNKGTITKAEIKEDNVVMGGNKPKEMVVDEGTKNPTNEKGEEVKPIDPPKTPSNPGTPSNPDPGPTITNVATLEELLAKLADTSVTNIKLTASFETTATIIINRAVIIDGNGQTITADELIGSDGTPGTKSAILVGNSVETFNGAVVIKNLTVVGPNTTKPSEGQDTWDSGEYGIKVYNASNVTLTDITVKDANAGVQVNSSTVKMTGKIDVSGNEFGGIEVAMGKTVDGAIPLKAPSLDITNAVITNTTETATTPTIWIDKYEADNLADAVVGGSLNELANTAGGKDQMFFFLDATKSGAQAMVDGVCYMSFTDTLKTLASGKTVTLLKDIEVVPDDLTSAWNRENMALALVIDLNENTLTVAGSGSVCVGYNDTDDTSGGKTAADQKGLALDITIKNGTISASNTQNAKANFIVEKGQKLTLDGVNGMTVNASGSAFLVRGGGATLNIKKSTVTAEGVYAISTNAADAVNYDVVINVTDNSTLTTAGDSDACPLMINVPGTLNVEDSAISGQRQAVIVRAGTAVFDGVTINAAPVKLGDGEHKYAANPAAWANGNRVAYGVVVVGGHKDNTYKADADVTLKDCTINLVNDSNLEAVTCGAVYVAAPGSTYSSLVTVSGTTTVTGPVVKYTGNTVKIAGYEGVVTVLPEVVQ